MKLSYERIKTITLGAVSVKQQADGVEFCRFTDAQQAMYESVTAEYQSAFHEKAEYTAGVKLSFKTNSRRLYLKGTFQKSIAVRRFFSVDVMVDGNYLDSLDNFFHKPIPRNYIDEPYTLGTFEKSFDLGEGEKTVCVHLPWSVKPRLHALELDDGAFLEPVKPAKKLLVFGDSITQGYDALRPWKRPAARLAEVLGAEEVNKAIGGERFFPPLARLRDDFEPDYIYVAYGTNDWGVGERNAFLANSKAFYAALRESYPQAKIFALTPIWRKNYLDEKAFGPFETVEQGIRDAVAELGNVHVIRGFDFVPKEEACFSDLRLHPNDAGFEHYFENLRNAICKELEL